MGAAELPPGNFARRETGNVVNYRHHIALVRLTDWLRASV
jgi:hypothetical protein